MNFNIPSVGKTVPSYIGLHVAHLTKHERCEKAWDLHVVK